MEAVEKLVQFDENGNATLKLGKHFSKKSARVVVLIKDEDIMEKEWLHLAMKGNAYNFLDDPSEDLYTMEDGKPYNKE